MTPLRRIRKKKKLSLRHVAREVGIHYSQLCRIENGEPTSAETAAKLSNFYAGKITEMQILYPKRYARRAA